VPNPTPQINIDLYVGKDKRADHSPTLSK